MTWLAWVVAGLVLVILEMMTASLFFFACLAIGAFAAAVFAYFGAANWMEYVAFAVLSIVAVFTIRPLFKSWLSKNGSAKSNVDELIGQDALVTEKISPKKDGFIKYKGEVWLASADSEIDTDTVVTIESISGTKAFVIKK